MNIPPSPTPYEELNRVLHDLALGVADVLVDDLIAVYLQGSFALGDYDEQSDVDFAVVTSDELIDDQVLRLQSLHAHLYDTGPRWARHLEGSYFPRDVIRDHTRAGGDLWYLDNGARQMIRHRHCNTRVVRHIVREHGIRLIGPEPRSLVEAVPVGALKDEVAAVLHRWGDALVADPSQIDNRWYQSFIVVMFCRMRQTLATGELASKRAGVDWAYRALPVEWHDLIRTAWADRPNPPLKAKQTADPYLRDRTIAFVQASLLES